MGRIGAKGQREQGQEVYSTQKGRIRLTPTAKYRVSAMEPKYAAVKGSRGPETRCLAYTIGPMRTAHERRKSREPTDHLDYW